MFLHSIENYHFNTIRVYAEHYLKRKKKHRQYMDHFSLFNSLYNKFPEMAFLWQYYRLLYSLPKEYCQLKFNKHCISIFIYLLHKYFSETPSFPTHNFVGLKWYFN